MPNLKNDLFLITSNNWKKQKELLYGFKTLNNNGIWTKVYWEKDSLIIKGSFIQPLLSLYKEKDFWAISNSLLVMERFLRANGKTLTESSFFKEQQTTDTFEFCAKCSALATKYNEISYIDNFSYISISDGQLQIIPILNDCFTIDTKNSKQILLTWYQKYTEYLSNLDPKLLTIQLSGGFDSRILFNMYPKQGKLSFLSHWQKAADTPHYYDGLLARWYLDKHRKDNYVFIETEEPVDQNLINNVYNTIYYGCFPAANKDAILPNGATKYCYHLAGMSLELHKWELGNSIEEIITTTRRFIINKYLVNYYAKGIITIAPYLDHDILKIKGANDNSFVYLLLGLFNINDPKIPYYSRERLWWISQEELDKELQKLENH